MCLFGTPQGYIAILLEALMEQAESVEVKKLSRTKQINLDVFNKMHSIRSDPESRAFGFSHGYLVLKSKPLTILGNFLYFGIYASLVYVILSFFMGPTRGPYIHFLHLHVARYPAQFGFYMSGAIALNTAFTLFEFGWRKRWIYTAIFAFLVLIAPMLLFHWPFIIH